LYFRLEGRAGQSVVQRAGTVSAVNNDALFPNVIDEFDSEAVAITELTYGHSVGDKTSIFFGLLNTAEGDENEIAGYALSNSHFLNSAMLYSLVQDATVPNVSLGGGISYDPNDEVSGSFSVFGTPETAGENPFELWDGTTFSTEWTFAHQWRNLPGAQTFGALYGIDASRTNIAASPRVVIGSILLGLPIPTTEADTWSYYYNAHQFIRGDADDGWGVFVRFGASDGNQRLKRNGGRSVEARIIPKSKQDGWGWERFAGLLQGLGWAMKWVAGSITTSPIPRFTSLMPR
jgi:porin